MSKQRTITLTGRPPVTVTEADWPELASDEDYWHNSHHWSTADPRERLTIAVRQHSDGRALVYSTYSYCSSHPRERDRVFRRGALLPEGSGMDAIVSAIQTVAGQMAEALELECCSTLVESPESLAHGCIADLPAEEL